MTNEPQGPPPTGEQPGESASADPVIAQQFSRLQELSTPSADDILSQADGGAIVGLDGPSVGGGRALLDGVTQYRVMAAAAVAAVLALGAVALTTRGADDVGTDEVAGEATAEVDAADGGDSDDDGDDDDAISSEAVTDEPATDSGSDDSDEVPVDTPEDSTVVDETESEDESVMVVEEPDGGASDDGASTPTTAAESTDQDTAEPSDDTEPVDETPDEPTDEIPPPTTEPVDPVPADTTRISGVVTEVLVDCQSHQVLGDSGQVEDTGAVTCDGGSFIVVNGTRIFTSAGYTAAEFYWDKHNSKLRPGVSVSVVAAPIAGGPLGLACDECGVRIG